MSVTTFKIEGMDSNSLTHKASKEGRVAQIRAAYAAVERTKKGYMKASSRAIWLWRLDGMGIGETRAKQIMREADKPAAPHHVCPTCGQSV